MVRWTNRCYGVDQMPGSRAWINSVERFLGKGVATACRSCLRSASLYHGTYFMMPYFPSVATILTVHDLIPLKHPELVTWRARLFFRLAFGMALRTSDHVVTISSTTRRDLTDHFPGWEERSTATILAADPRFHRQAPDAIRRVRSRYTLPVQYVLYVGSNRPHKNLVRLVEAWPLADTGDAVLIIAGAWDERFPEARTRASALGSDARVRFLGPVSDEELPGLYSGAEVFVFPSLCEGFGLPVLEAMACGVPVVCST